MQRYMGKHISSGPSPKYDRIMYVGPTQILCRDLVLQTLFNVVKIFEWLLLFIMSCLKIKMPIIRDNQRI